MLITPQTAENEYQKNPDIKKDEILKIIKWMETQPHLPKIPEVNVIVSYHSCNNSIELTKNVIDLHYSLRTVLPQFFKNKDPEFENQINHFDVTLFAPLEQLTPEGYKVLYCRLLDYDPSHFFFDNVVKCFVMISDLLQLQYGTFNGFIITIDMEGVTLGHVGRLGLMTIKNILYYLQEAMPVRLKGFSFLNTPSFMDKILAMMKPFMNQSLKDILQLHPSPETVFKTIPKDLFPSNMGGKYKTFEEIRDEIKELMLANRQFLIDEEKRRVQEKLRPGKPKDFGESVGIQGNFKKLEID